MTLEQKKLIACAELAGLKHKACKCGCGSEYWVTEYKIIFQICLFATSLDAIVPVVVKWCGEDYSKWGLLFTALGYPHASYNPAQAIEIVRLLLKKSASQIRDALLLAAGKMPKE